jgi:tRNA(fMet)-specific endonuclease VapC
MAGDVLLDSNIVIAFFAKDPGVLSRIVQVNFLIPSIVLGELHAGAQKSLRAAENLARIDAAFPNSIILNCDYQTAQVYGVIKQALRIKGRPIPKNDVWIAAVAQQYRLPLITRDEHFAAVDGLSIEKW